MSHALSELIDSLLRRRGLPSASGLSRPCLHSPQRWARRLCIDVAAAAAAKSLQSCPTLCDPTDGSLLGSSVSGILQARIPEWVAISFSNA